MGTYPQRQTDKIGRLCSVSPLHHCPRHCRPVAHLEHSRLHGGSRASNLGPGTLHVRAAPCSLARFAFNTSREAYKNGSSGVVSGRSRARKPTAFLETVNPKRYIYDLADDATIIDVRRKDAGLLLIRFCLLPYHESLDRPGPLNSGNTTSACIVHLYPDC